MKKLMIALAAVAVSVIANAASVNWEVGGIQTTGDFDNPDGTESYAAGYSVYLFNNATLSRATMAGYLAEAASGETDWSTALSSSSMWHFVGDDTYGGGSKNGLSADNGTFTGYMVILDAATVADATYAFITDTYSAADNSMHVIAFNTFDYENYVNALDYSTAGQAGSNWTAVAPEPTSGLLLLLGMAGLALRRRRA